MKTPTLIVRLVGLYLLAQNTVALLQVQKLREMGGGMGGMGLQQNIMVGDIQLYAIIGLLLGLAATAFAGPLARAADF